VLKNILRPNAKFVVPLVLVIACVLYLAGFSKNNLNQNQAVLPEKSAAPSLMSAAGSIDTTATPANPEPSQVASDTAFSLSAVGDINVGSRPASYVKEFGYPYKNIRDILKSSDLAFGNLECALSTRGKPIPGKEFTFRGSPEDARFLAGTGFNVLSVANNHSKDYGEDAFLDTLTFLEQAEIVSSGGGKNLSEAYRPGIVEVKGQKVAFLSFSDVLPAGFAATASSCGVASLRDRKMVFGAIKEAKSEADFVVVSIHWGKELSIYPSKQHIDLAYELVDRGVDLILGHHPHVVQGIEAYKGKIIAYSMGNFMFSPGSPKGRQSIILNINVDSNEIVGVKIYPVYIDGIRPVIISGEQGEAWLKEVAQRSQSLNTAFEPVFEDIYPYLKLSF